MDYGVDEYGRYKQYADGERFVIEPFPYWNTWHAIWLKPFSRLTILLWHIGMIRQHGLCKWNHDRKY